ncbi:hypothetical protein CLU83_2088 [Flavobacterium sp. 1]|nr:hypothetical protein CLU83_2088 [Flavobacterium sp. 1]
MVLEVLISPSLNRISADSFLLVDFFLEIYYLDLFIIFSVGYSEFYAKCCKNVIFIVEIFPK